MSQIARTFFRLFGLGGTADNFGQFGSKRAGSPTTTKDVTVIQALDAWNNGIQDAVVSANKAPYLEDLNGLFYAFANQIAYILQAGVPEWDASTTYYVGSMVRRAGSAQVYQSVANANLNQALPGTATVPISDSFWQYIQMQGPPPGIISPYAGSTVPAGYLFCDGGAVSRVTYAALFAVIGTTYGIGDGVTTFNTPDLVGRTTFMLNASDPEFPSLNYQAGGTHHTHGQSSHTHVIDALSLQHSTNFGVSPFTVTPDQYAQAGGVMGINPTPSGIGAVNQWKSIHAMTEASVTESAQPPIDLSGNMPPYRVVNYIIKT